MHVFNGSITNLVMSHLKILSIKNLPLSLDGSRNQPSISLAIFLMIN